MNRCEESRDGACLSDYGLLNYGLLNYAILCQEMTGGGNHAHRRPPRHRALGGARPALETRGSKADLTG